MIKKCLAAILLLVLLIPAICSAEAQLRGYTRKEGYQYVQLGNFPQEADGTEKPILWRVLTVNDEYAYLFSEHVLFANRIDPDDVYYQEINAQFNLTEMYRLLNGPFEGNPVSLEEQQRLNDIERLGYAYIAEKPFVETAFTDAERGMLITDEELGTVFLVSAEDLKTEEYGFVTAKARQGFGTEYAYTTGLFEYGNHSSPYWTRTQGVNYKYATRCTKVDGSIGYIRCVVMNEGCRPAVRLRLDGLETTGGDGTKENPFTFAR